MDNSSDNNRISQKVQEFYSKVPFPGFDLRKYNSYLDLYKNANLFAKKLDYQIPYNVSIVDIGCGTGQLACLLSLKERTVLGIDFVAESLGKAKTLVEKLFLKNIDFKTEDILNLDKPYRHFDYIFCLGVLHHTADPYRGFKNIIQFGKNGSYVTIGLYNKYGRLFLKLKQFFHSKFSHFYSKRFRRAATELHGKDEKDKEKDYSWFVDQYEHPYETTHTLGEVLSWFKKNNIAYINTIPSASLFAKNDFKDIFKADKKPVSSPTILRRCLAQLKWIITLRKTGGYFIVIGRMQ